MDNGQENGNKINLWTLQLKSILFHFFLCIAFSRYLNNEYHHLFFSITLKKFE